MSIQFGLPPEHRRLLTSTHGCSFLAGWPTTEFAQFRLKLYTMVAQGKQKAGKSSTRNNVDSCSGWFPLDLFLPPLFLRRTTHAEFASPSVPMLLMMGHVIPLMPPLAQPGMEAPRFSSGCKNLQFDSIRHHPFDFQCLHTMVRLSESEVADLASMSSTLYPSSEE